MISLRILPKLIIITSIISVCLCLGLATRIAHAADPDAALNRLLTDLEKDHGLKFSSLKDNRRTIELVSPVAKDRTQIVYLFAPKAAVVFGQRYITLYGFAAPSKGVDLLKSMNRSNASTLLGTWFVGQNNLLTYKIVVPDSIKPADFNNLIMLVAGASDTKEKELTGNDKY
jgi:hypothetical protein